MAFLVLPPKLAAYLIQGEADELTPAADAKIHKIKSMVCPRCKSSMAPRIADNPFSENDPLPKMWATCDCGTTIDPDTGLVVDLGSAAKVTPSIPLIRPSEDR